jgi:hypothetical protein
MCTSFWLYSGKTYIGMNFDISDRPILLTLKDGSQFIVVQKDGPSFYQSFGINKSGAFINMLMVDPTEAGMYRRGKNCVHVSRLLAEVLGGLSAEGLETLLREKTIVNPPAISVHSLVTAEDHTAWVVEPGRKNLRYQPPAQNFAALTNFPLSGCVGLEYSQVEGGGADRYKTCYRLLLENQAAFSLERGFDILKATRQDGGDWPTQFSMLAVPEDGCIYFSVRRDYDRRFKFSFADQTIRAERGFARAQEQALNAKGISLDELARWQ